MTGPPPVERKSPPLRPARAESEATAQALASADPGLPLGARLYNCSACHFVTGQGSPGVFPALDRNSLVTSEEPRPLIDIILNGAEVPGTEKRPMALVMQGCRERLLDAEVAELASFLRKAWGNGAGPVEAELVSEVRAEDPP